MDRRVLTTLFLLGMGACAGCQSDPHIRFTLEKMNAEKRMLQDRVYALEYDLDIANDEIKRLKENGADESPRRKSLTPSLLNNPSSPSRKPVTPSPSLVPPDIDSGAPMSPKIDLGEPEIDLGTPSQVTPPLSPPAPTKPTPRSPLPPPSENSATETSTNISTPQLEPLVPPASPPNDDVPRAPTRDDSAPATEPSPAVSNEAKSITHLYVNPFLTRAADFDNKSGDDGIILLIEPRNVSNEYIALAGAVTVVVLDPAKNDDSARVARWDIPAADVARHVRRPPDDPGIQLQLTWPGPRPENSQLRLFVRYETPDGRRLQGEQGIYVTLPGQIARGWIQKSNRSPAPVANPPMMSEHVGESGPVPPPPSHVPPISMPNADEPRSVLLPRPEWKPER